MRHSDTAAWTQTAGAVQFCRRAVLLEFRKCAQNAYFLIISAAAAHHGPAFLFLRYRAWFNPKPIWEQKDW